MREQLRPQCGRNWKQAVKLSIALKLSNSKAASKLRLKFFGNGFDKIFSIVGAVLSLLFFFKNYFTDLPIHQHTLKIHTANGFLLCISNNGLNLQYDVF